MTAGLLLKFNSKFEKELSQHRIIIICDSVTYKKTVDTEVLNSVLLQNLECIKKLRCCHSVFCISRAVHDAVADLEDTARIVAAAHRLRKFSDCPCIALDHGKVIEIDDGIHIRSIDVFFRRRIIGRKHRHVTGIPDSFRHHEFSE